MALPTCWRRTSHVAGAGRVSHAGMEGVVLPTVATFGLGSSRTSLSLANCMAVHNTAPLCAIGVTDPSSPERGLKSTITVVKMNIFSGDAERSSSTDTTLSLCGAPATLSAPLSKGLNGAGSMSSSMSWGKSTLICGTTTGQVLLYKADPHVLEHSAPSARSPLNLLNSYCDPPLLPETTGGSSGHWVINPVICRVQYHPWDESQFLAVQGRGINFWDPSHLDAPLLRQRQLSHQAPLLCGEWSPHDRNVVGVGSASGAISLLDTRMVGQALASHDTADVPVNAGGAQSAKSIWSSGSSRGVGTAAGTPNGGERALSWNPFLPHCLASAGSSSFISVWDTRMAGAGPALFLEGHGSHVAQLSWSLTHADMITR